MKNIEEDNKSDGAGEKKLLAKAHMSFVKPLSPYNSGASFFKG